MNIDELLAALDRADVDPDDYEVVPCTLRMRTRADWWYMAQSRAGGWDVGTFERGVYEPALHFDTEEDACQYFYGLVTRPHPEPVQINPEEYALGVDLTEQRRRAFFEDLKREGTVYMIANPGSLA